MPDEGDGGEGPAERHQDTKLQTPYTGARRERLLLNTYYTTRSTSGSEDGLCLPEDRIHALVLVVGKGAIERL